MITKPGLQYEIFKAIPNTFDFEMQLYTCSKKYINQYKYNETPAIVIGFESNERYDNPIGNAGSTKFEEKTIVFHTGTDVYKLNKDHIDDIEWVQATVGGVSVIMSASLYEIDGGDSIEFLGLTYPDDGTEVTVKYHFQWVKVKVGGWYIARGTIDVYVGHSDCKKDVLLADYIAIELRDWFELDFDIDECSAHEVTSVMNLDDTVADAKLRRRQFGITILYSKFKYRYVESIEEVSIDVETNST